MTRIARVAKYFPDYIARKMFLAFDSISDVVIASFPKDLGIQEVIMLSKKIPTSICYIKSFPFPGRTNNHSGCYNKRNR